MFINKIGIQTFFLPQLGIFVKQLIEKFDNNECGLRGVHSL